MLLLIFRHIRFIFVIAALAACMAANGQIGEGNEIYYDTTSYLPVFYKGAIDYNLMIAASAGYTAEITRLLNKGADINAEYQSGATPLIYAVSSNNTEAAKLLINNGADVNKITGQNESPLLIAVKLNNPFIAEALIRADANIDFADKHNATALHFAAAYGYLSIADLLLYYDASIDVKSSDGYTPLMVAVWSGQTEIADLLLQRGANPDSPNNDGFTPFMIASYFGDTIMMDLLVKKNADIYAKNKFHQDALTIAIVAGQIESINYLMKAGNRWATHDRDVTNPFTAATKVRRKDIMNILEANDIKGKISYGIDQVSVTASSRFCLNDIYTGMSVSLKEPWLNAGLIAGCDTKLWYTRVLLKSSEHLYYQYRDKSSLVYAGVFRDFNITNRPGKYNFSASVSLLAGYTFGNMLKGTFIAPDNKLLAIPEISFKISKKSLTYSLGMEYVKTSFYNDGPIWLRAGISYTHFLDKSRSVIKPVRWY